MEADQVRLEVFKIAFYSGIDFKAVSIAHIKHNCF